MNFEDLHGHQMDDVGDFVVVADLCFCLPALLVSRLATRFAAAFDSSVPFDPHFSFSRGGVMREGG